MKWKEVTLSDVSHYSKERINVNELTLKNYVSTENMLPEKGGKKIATSLPGGSVIKYKCGQTLISVFYNRNLYQISLENCTT